MGLVTAGTVIRGSCPQHRVLSPIFLLSVQPCSSSFSLNLPPLAPLEELPAECGEKERPEGKLGIWGIGRQGEILWVMSRLERLERPESMSLQCMCVCERYFVCTQGVYMCGCMHNACVTGLCRWLLRACTHVYIVQGWDLETQDHSACLSGLLCVCTWVCDVFFVHVTTHSTNNRMSYVSVTLSPSSQCFRYFSCSSESLCKRMCVCGLRVPVTYV